MTTGAKIACHDNSTRGLDASTAVEYARSLRIATDVSHLTTVLSIYQCGEQMLGLGLGFGGGGVWETSVPAPGRLSIQM